MFDSETFRKRFEAQVNWDTYFESREWVSKIPYLSLPSDIEFKVIPPFAGAVCRFMCKKGSKTISVYLDCYDVLGCMSQPYWEIYPYKGDTYRCYLNETEELSEKIMEELNREESENDDEHIWG